eukprot:8598351-Pyramimonas_sp.AAC.1
MPLAPQSPRSRAAHRPLPSGALVQNVGALRVLGLRREFLIRRLSLIESRCICTFDRLRSTWQLKLHSNWALIICALS